jgi:hypothetical protein
MHSAARMRTTVSILLLLAGCDETVDHATPPDMTVTEPEVNCRHVCEVVCSSPARIDQLACQSGRRRCRCLPDGG